MESRDPALQALLDEIRECTDCNIVCQSTPVVYSAITPKIMVVSETPLKRAWECGLGREWEGSLEAKKVKKGTTYELCKLLDILDEADQLLFWIQRANCSVDRRRGDVFSHCSENFIPRAIQVVRPRLVITLGRSATRYFLPFTHLSEVVGSAYPREANSVKYTLVPMFHPSKANGAARKRFEAEHKKSIAVATAIVEQIKRDAKSE